MGSTGKAWSSADGKAGRIVRDVFTLLRNLPFHPTMPVPKAQPTPSRSASDLSSREEFYERRIRTASADWWGQQQDIWDPARPTETPSMALGFSALPPPPPPRPTRSSSSASWPVGSVENMSARRSSSVRGSRSDTSDGPAESAYAVPELNESRPMPRRKGRKDDKVAREMVSEDWPIGSVENLHSATASAAVSASSSKDGRHSAFLSPSGPGPRAVTATSKVVAGDNVEMGLNLRLPANAQPLVIRANLTAPPNTKLLVNGRPVPL